jgi:hypothetical protein
MLAVCGIADKVHAQLQANKPSCLRPRAASSAAMPGLGWPSALQVKGAAQGVRQTARQVFPLTELQRFVVPATLAARSSRHVKLMLGHTSQAIAVQLLVA